MANQPTKYRKFVVGAASAALVASAVAPVASAATKDFSDIKGNTHEDAIKALVEKGVINGYEDGTFKPNKTLTRSDVVKMMGKWLVSLGYEVPADYKTKPRFTDQTSETNEELLKYSAVVKDNGVFNGYENGSLGAAGEITRENMALVLVRAFDTINDTDLVKYVEEQEFDKDVIDRAQAKAEARPYIDVLDYFDITNPAAPQFNPKGITTRGHFATFLHKTSQVELPDVEVSVENITAINASTLEVTGAGLDKLKAEDVTVTDNAVTAVTASADGKTATVTLGTLLNPNVEYTVKADNKEFKVVYKLVANTAAITEATYDDDRANQFVAFSVNGLNANVADLLANGYTVKFTATDKNGSADKTNELFANTTTGLLKTTGLAEEYKVQVTLSTGTDVIVSPLQTIKIKNLDLAATTINDYKFTNDTTGVIQNSTKMVVGETGSFTQLDVLMDGSEEKIAAPAEGFKVESSNKAVASVKDGVVTAHTPGTTTLTITYGNVTKAVVVTVENAQRELKSLKVTEKDSEKQIYNLTVIKGNKDVTISPLDQYGDPMNKNVNIESTDNTVINAPAVVNVTAAGKADVQITALKAGSASLLFKNPANNTTLATFGVKVTENAGVATKKLEIVAPKDSDNPKQSADNTLDLSDDAIVKYKLNQYNSEGVANGSVDLAADQYTATSTDTTIATVDITGDVLTITGVKKGTATINLVDKANVNVGTITVTVVDNGPTISGVTFKPQNKLDYPKTVNYETFLTYTEAAPGKDPAISGVALSKTTTNKVRLNVASGKLYIDTDGNSEYDAAIDTTIGKIDLTATTDSTNLAPLNGSVAVGNGAKGTLIFTVQEDKATNAKIYASTSLEVDVK